MSWLRASILYQKLQKTSGTKQCYLYRIKAEICRRNPELSAPVLFPPLVVSSQQSSLVRLEENKLWFSRLFGFLSSLKVFFLLHRQHNLLLKPPKLTVFTLIKHVLKYGIWAVPNGVREGNGDLAWCHYLYVREEGNNCNTAVACNGHYSRKESHKGVKPCYSFTLFQICWNESKRHKSPLWFLIFSSWVFICDCLNWNVWCRKAAGSQSLFAHKEHFRL